MEQPWESTLLYSQVEKENKETPIGYEAKLRNAKLNYYTGNFTLAEGHLSILKDATTREIANDALDLSLLIKNNSIGDTSNAPLADFAHVDLMIFKNQLPEASLKLYEMLEKYNNHSLVDEVCFRLARIQIQQGRFEEAVLQLEKIIEGYGSDILGDDAYYQLGVVYQDHLNQKQRAMEIFQDLLTRYPGSLYVADARRRFRLLRGDAI
jgi:TolA-binding protein